MSFKSGLSVYPLRLKPGDELKSSLRHLVNELGLKAAFILTCCGSVTKATLRFATKTEAEHNIKIQEIYTFNEHFEICSLVGTFSSENNAYCHLHATLGRQDGSTVSGHVVGDMVVDTTVEVVIGECDSVLFTREDDPNTGYSELVVGKREDAC